MNQALFWAQGRQQKITQTKISASVKPTFYWRETDVNRLMQRTPSCLVMMVLKPHTTERRMRERWREREREREIETLRGSDWEVGRERETDTKKEMRMRDQERRGRQA